MNTILNYAFLILLLPQNAGQYMPDGTSDYLRPLPTGEQLNAVCFGNDDIAFCAGENGTILRRSVRHGNWEKCESQIPEDLNGIHFADKYNGIAVGKRGVIIRTTDSGITWNSCRSRNMRELFDVKFTDRSTALACGLGGTVLKTSDSGSNWSLIQMNTNDPLYCIDLTVAGRGCAGSYNSVYMTSDTGKSWVKHQFTFTPSAQVSGICIVDSLTIYASSGTAHGRFISSTDGGSNWTATSLNLPSLYGGAADLVRDLSFTDRLRGSIVTEYGTVLRTTDGGLHWSTDSSFRPSSEKPSVMKGITGNEFETVICGGGGTVFILYGDSLKPRLECGGFSDIETACVLDKMNWIIGGEGNGIYSTSDAGLSWQTKGNTVSDEIYSMDFQSPQSVFAATQAGIEHSKDGGNHWKAIYKGSEKLFALSVRGQHVIAAGGLPEIGMARIIRSSDSGQTWNACFTGSIGHVTDVYCVTDEKIFASTSFGKVMVSSDMGLSWQVLHAADEVINCILFKNSSTGFCGSDDGIILKTTDGGNIWELIFTGRSYDINSVQMTNEGLVAVGEEGHVVLSIDEGETWKELGKATSNELSDVICIPGNRIICFGDYGTVIQYDLNLVPISRQFVKKKGGEVSEIFASPNPAVKGATVTIELRSGLYGQLETALYDLAGRQVHVSFTVDASGGKESLSINTTSLTSGIYFLILRSGDRRISAKLAIVN